jgi:hypothetical protein
MRGIKNLLSEPGKLEERRIIEDLQRAGEQCEIKNLMI